MDIQDIKVGDKVFPTKPQDISEFPVWVSGMDPYDGKIGTVISVQYTPYEQVPVIDFGDGRSPYQFNAKWLSLVDPDASVVITVKSSDSCTCSARDLMWFGHKCSRKGKAPIDLKR